MRRWAALLCAILIGCGANTPTPAEESAIVDENSPYDFHRALAGTLLRTEQYRRAMPYVRRLIKMRPEKSEPHFLLARVYSGLGLDEAAVQSLQQSIQLDEKYLPAISMLGIAYDRLGKHDEAEKWHRRALAQEQSSIDYHNNLGFCLYLQGRYREALSYYLSGLKVDSGSQRLLNNLGFTYGRLGEMDKAYQHFRAAGGEASAANNLGLVHESRGDLEQAYGQFVQAVQADPAMSSAHGNLQRVCGQLGRPVPPLPEARRSDGAGSMPATDAAEGAGAPAPVAPPALVSPGGQPSTAMPGTTAPAPTNPTEIGK